jgi:hypothetical protein
VTLEENLRRQRVGPSTPCRQDGHCLWVQSQHDEPSGFEEGKNSSADEVSWQSFELAWNYSCRLDMVAAAAVCPNMLGADPDKR